MRRLIVTTILVLSGACDLAETLDGEPCEVDRDCSRKQSCLRTDAERENDLPGVCSDDDDECVLGQQLGCACTPDTYPTDCSTPVLSSTVEYPDMTCDPTQLVCIVTPIMGATTEG